MASVRDILARKGNHIETITPTATVFEAAVRMNSKKIGALLVLDEDRLVGIITERDILRAVAQRARAAEARVRQWMTESVITIEPETTVQDAAKMMFERNFRHLPVSKDGRLLGIVSLRRLSQYEFEHAKESVGPAH